jgi:hypothetical protein
LSSTQCQCYCSCFHQNSIVLSYLSCFKIPSLKILNASNSRYSLSPKKCSKVINRTTVVVFKYSFFFGTFSSLYFSCLTSLESSFFSCLTYAPIQWNHLIKQSHLPKQSLLRASDSQVQLLSLFWLFHLLTITLITSRLFFSPILILRTVAYSERISLVLVLDEKLHLIYFVHSVSFSSLIFLLRLQKYLMCQCKLPFMQCLCSLVDFCMHTESPRIFR